MLAITAAQRIARLDAKVNALAARLDRRLNTAAARAGIAHSTRNVRPAPGYDRCDAPVSGAGYPPESNGHGGWL